MDVEKLPRDVQIVIRLLETLDDVRLGSTAEESGTPGEKGARIHVLDPLYHAGTYRELEACLLELRKQGERAGDGRSLYFHVREWWVDAVGRQVWLPKLVRNQKGLLVPLRNADGEPFRTPVVLWTRHPKADHQHAVEGATWIARVGWPTCGKRSRRFRREPMLPKDLLNAA
jgi:hypothetical protein